MPLPFILVGVAILAGGYGVKKGFDAKEDFDTADRVNDKARALFSKGKKELEVSREAAQSAMNDLGKMKFSIYQSQLIPFVDAFDKIIHLDFDNKGVRDNTGKLKFDPQELKSIGDSALAMKDVVNGGVAALGVGGIAGLAAYGGVGALGAASTGTAIAGLSGVAATNATLAWLGGGSLAAGGFGMAGGVAVLGGIVAGPVLAVGGIMLASKAEEAKEDAYSNLKKAELHHAEMQSAAVVTNGIRGRFDEVALILSRLNEKFMPLLADLQRLVGSNKDYRTYSTADRRGVHNCYLFAKTIKNLLEAPVIDKSGALVDATHTRIKNAQRSLTAFDPNGQFAAE